jgi:ABC-type dipeptide/oligopeptide/nickel transport system permease subunit
MLFFFVCTTSPLFSAIIIIITTTATTSIIIIIIILIEALFECCLAQATGIKRKKYAVAASAMSKRPVRRGGWNHWGT